MASYFNSRVSMMIAEIELLVSILATYLNQSIQNNNNKPRKGIKNYQIKKYTSLQLGNPINYCNPIFHHPK